MNDAIRQNHSSVGSPEILTKLFFCCAAISGSLTFDEIVRVNENGFFRQSTAGDIPSPMKIAKVKYLKKVFVFFESRSYLSLSLSLGHLFVGGVVECAQLSIQTQIQGRS